MYYAKQLYKKGKIDKRFNKNKSTYNIKKYDIN